MTEAEEEGVGVGIGRKCVGILAYNCVSVLARGCVTRQVNCVTTTDLVQHAGLRHRKGKEEGCENPPKVQVEELSRGWVGGCEGDRCAPHRGTATRRGP